MAVLNAQQAALLTPKGFYEEVKRLLPDLTVEQAYHEVERSHIAITGERRYSDFESFNVIKKRYDKARK